MNRITRLPIDSAIQGPLQLPLLQLLHSREYGRYGLVAIAIGVFVGIIGVRVFGWPLWVASAVALVAFLAPTTLKWRADWRRLGLTVALLGALLTVQGLHTIEHIAQWLQYHILFWSMRQSSGLISPANAEWVHFVWNWGVLISVLLLVRGGLRNIWAGFLLGVALAHTLEHTYAFIRYLMVLGELRDLGVTNVTAQGLPGILGRDGWLARSAWTQGTILCSIPGLTTAIRLDVHFWWNVIEMTLLGLAGHFYLRNRQIQRLPQIAVPELDADLPNNRILQDRPS